MSRRRDGLRQHRVRFHSTRVDELERDHRAAAADVPRSVGLPAGRCGDGSRPARLSGRRVRGVRLTLEWAAQCWYGHGRATEVLEETTAAYRGDVTVR